MQKTLSINVHEQDLPDVIMVDRRHYTVAQLIAELSKYDGETEIVVKNLSTGNYGSIDFQGLTAIKSESPS